MKLFDVSYCIYIKSFYVLARMNENTEIVLLYPKFQMVCERVRISILNILYMRSILFIKHYIYAWTMKT